MLRAVVCHCAKMCFSAAASFTAGALLTPTGCVTVKNAPSRRYVPFAAIPLLFGIQQLAEGFVWLALGGMGQAQRFESQSAHLYAFFAFAFWPLFVPFAVLCLEGMRKRKAAIGALLALGLVVGATMLYDLVTYSLRADVSGHSVVYHLHTWSSNWGMVAYVVATCGSCLVSSHRFVRLFGGAMLVSAAVAFSFYEVAFTSTWCFFAAFLSAGIYLHFAPLPFRAGKAADEPLEA